MTLPTRPAPAPPGSRAQNAAANANASLEQLRLQLQQQQQLQRQNVTVPKLTIKLPPPPKGPHPNTLLHNGFASHNNNTTAAGAAATQGSITRKFPQARYAPATNWDDSPFDALSSSAAINTNGNYKKPPPPRPPPPKIQPKKPSAPPGPVQSSSILSNIFHRKKSSRAPTPNSASRVYGAATYGTSTATSSSSASSSASHSLMSSSSSHLNTFSQTSWNNAWNTTPNCAAAQHTQSTSATAEGQLISFDSPPSSPTFTQKSNSDCLSVDSFSSDSNFSSPNNGSVSQPESGFEDDFSANARSSRPATTSPLDPWETLDAFGQSDASSQQVASRYGTIGTAPVRNLNMLHTRVPGSGNAAGDNPLCNGKSLLPPAPALNMPTIIKPKISQKPKAPRPPSLAKVNGSILYTDNLITPPSPPMPQCAPPPPPPSVGGAAASGSSHAGLPSLLDVISGKVDALELYPGGGGDVSTEQPYGIALYDFTSTEDGDLCFRENEKIYLIEQVSAEWYRGRTRSGCEGIFPVNYIEIKVPLTTNTTTATSISQHTAATESSYSTTGTTYQNNSSSSSSTKMMQVKSLYNFPAEVQGDLELKENDLVTVLYRINEDWLYGELNGRQGQFPANFLEYVPSNIAMP